MIWQLVSNMNEHDIRIIDITDIYIYTLISLVWNIRGSHVIVLTQRATVAVNIAIENSHRKMSFPIKKW